MNNLDLYNINVRGQGEEDRLYEITDHIDNISKLISLDAEETTIRVYNTANKTWEVVYGKTAAGEEEQKDKTQDSERFFTEAKKTGIIFEANKCMYCLNAAGLKTICDKFAVYKQGAKGNDYYRNRMLVNWLCEKAKGKTKTGLMLDNLYYVVRNVSQDKKYNVITSAVTDRYGTYADLTIIYEMIRCIRDKGETIQLRSWCLTDDKACADVELTRKTRHLTCLGKVKSVTPGYRIITSNTGHASLTMQAVVFGTGTCEKVIGERSKRHTSKFDPCNDIRAWTDALENTIADYFASGEEMAKVTCPKQEVPARVRTCNQKLYNRIGLKRGRRLDAIITKKVMDKDRVTEQDVRIIGLYIPELLSETERGKTCTNTHSCRK